MAIYDIFEAKTPEEEKTPPPVSSKKDRFFSSLTARLLFFLLFLADIVWGAYALVMFMVCLTFSLSTFFKIERFVRPLRKHFLSLKRASACGLALLVALFSTALGIMIGCTYFLMYDKTGIQEVVPTSLQEQFQEFLK